MAVLIYFVLYLPLMAFHMYYKVLTPEPINRSINYLKKLPSRSSTPILHLTVTGREVLFVNS